MKKNKQILILIIALMVVVGLFGILNNQSHDTGVIKVGFIGSLTGVDPSYGESMKGGVEIAVDEINRNGGIKGKKIEVVYEDGKCIDSKSAISAFQKLYNVDGVRIIIGGGCSNEVSSISKLVNDNKVFLISSGATSPDIAGSSKYIFRNSPNDTESSRQLAGRIIQDGFNDIAIVSDNSDYSVGFKKTFLNEFNKIGGNVVGDVVVQPNQSDYRSDILKLKSINSKAILVNPNVPKTAGLLVKQIREAGITSKIYLSYSATPEFFKIVGDLADDSTVINLPKVSGEKSSEILNVFESKYGHKTVYEYNTVAAYDAVIVIKDAISIVGSDPEKIIDYASKNKFTGALGKFGFNDQGDISGMKFTFLKVKGRELLEI